MVGYQFYVDYNHPQSGQFHWGKSQRDDIVTFSGNGNELKHRFRFNPARNPYHDPFPYDSYGVNIYEYNPNTRKDIKWVASSDFRPGQASAYVSVDWEYYSDLSIYYCTID